MHLAGARRLQVHNDADPAVHRADIHCAAGLEADLIAGITKLCQQRVHRRLGQRLAAGHGNKAGLILCHLIENLLQGAFLATVEGVLGITPDTALRTTGQANEYRRPADAARLALKGVEYLGDAKVHGCLRRPREEPTGIT